MNSCVYAKFYWNLMTICRVCFQINQIVQKSIKPINQTHKQWSHETPNRQAAVCRQIAIFAKRPQSKQIRANLNKRLTIFTQSYSTLFLSLGCASGVRFRRLLLLFWARIALFGVIVVAVYPGVATYLFVRTPVFTLTFWRTIKHKWAGTFVFRCSKLAKFALLLSCLFLFDENT